MHPVEKEKQLNRPRRSRSITILAFLHLVQSLVLMGFSVYLVSTAGWSQTGVTEASRFLPLALFGGMLSGAVTLTLAVLGILIAIALLRLKSWAWMAAISLQGLGLLAALIAYVRGQPNYVGMLMGILLVFYLNQQDIRATFRSKITTEVHGTYPPGEIS